jgi:hypothetical protein
MNTSEGMHTHPCEHTYANSTPMSTFEGLSTSRSVISEANISDSLSTGTPLTT